MNVMKNKESATLYRWVEQVINRPIITVLAVLLISAVFIMGLRDFSLASSPRDYQGPDGEHMKVLLRMEREFSEEFNVLVVFVSSDERGYTQDTLTAIRQFTDTAWTLPKALRVDSIANFQYSEAQDDDLVVRDLIEDAALLDKQTLSDIGRIVGQEPRLLNMLASSDGRALAVNIKFDADTNNLRELLQIQHALEAAIEATENAHPQLSGHISGFLGVTLGWNSALIHDVSYLFTGSFVIVVLSLCLFFRSVPLAAITILIALLSVASSAGFTGLLGKSIQAPVSVGLLMVILLAIADSIHVVQTARRKLGMGMPHKQAVIESVVFNFKAILITSVTTAIGFMSFFFSSYEGVRLLGAYVALGVMVACLLSLTLLPCVMARCRIKPGPVKQSGGSGNRLAGLVIRWRWLILASLLPSVVLCVFSIKRTPIEDNIIDYMQPWQKIRQDIDIIEDELTGSMDINFQIDSGNEQGVSDPAFMRVVDDFALWARAQPEVRWVSTYTDVMKKLNQDMHGGNVDFYHLPSQRDLAAQYLLLYELLLPQGLDLTYQINADKSSTRVTIIVDDLDSGQLFDLMARIDEWIESNATDLQISKPMGSLLLTMLLSMETITVMVSGAALALAVIGVILFFVFRAFTPGLLCVFMVITPILVTYGIWGGVVGRFDMSAAIALCMVVGIVVDNAVHFVTKFLQARQVSNLSTENAIEYTFSNIGNALVSNALVLSAGFSLLFFSAFKSNATMGIITTMSILAALIGTFTLLPALLVVLDRSRVSE
jgi:uncharacterized protein